ncbi:hypothetical protein, partial [Stackebrandtia soli]|uniref:hypothetical protein n=1 Tax=Stackebrandtia soli TaxID=1892856 RepID=UPI0039ED80E0
MLTASGCTGESPDPSSSPTATTETAPDVVSAQDHLAVTESGFTVGENDNDDTTVTYAIILKNTHPTHAAIRIGIELTWTTGGEPIPVT